MQYMDWQNNNSSVPDNDFIDLISALLQYSYIQYHLS